MKRRLLPIVALALCLAMTATVALAVTYYPMAWASSPTNRVYDRYATTFHPDTRDAVMSSSSSAYYYRVYLNAGRRYGFDSLQSLPASGSQGHQGYAKFTVKAPNGRTYYPFYMSDSRVRGYSLSNFAAPASGYYVIRVSHGKGYRFPYNPEFFAGRRR